MKYRGRVHKFGDDINTDEIIPARYLHSTNAEELAAHCMEDADKKFSKRVKPGDIIVAGKNFGCGSSREHAPAAIKACGVSCVVAKSFARIFYRNAINIGLPIVVFETADLIKKRDLISVDTKNGTIKNLTKRKIYKSETHPPFIRRIIKAGGHMRYIKK